MSWPIALVGELADQIRGVSYAQGEASSTPKPGYEPILRAGNIADDGLHLDDLSFVPSSRIAEKQRVRRYDVVIAASSGSLAIVGKAAQASEDFGGAFGAFCKVLRLRSTKVDPIYFGHFFKTTAYRRRVSALAKGVNINNLKNEHLDQLLIPVPPLEEQRRIAELLDRTESLRTRRMTALQQLETFRRSIFFDMFGNPATNPMGWPVKMLGELCSVKGGKRLPKGEEYSSVPSPFRYIRVVDLKEGVVDESALAYLKPEVQARIARYTVSSADVIVSIAGSIGEVAWVPASLEGANLTENAAKLVPRQANEYLPRYLSSFLRLPYAQWQLQAQVGQVTIGKLALFRLERIRVPLPSLDLQNEYVALLESMDSLAQRELHSATALDSLFSSLQRRAFQGEL